MEEKDKRDYEEFVGRIILWKSSGYWHRAPFQVKVVGCDYHVGLTLVNPNDSEDFFTCILGKAVTRLENVTNWDSRFSHMVSMIREGIFDCDELEPIMTSDRGSLGVSSGNPTSKDCPFGGDFG